MRLCSGCQTKVPDGVRFCAVCRAERNKPGDNIKAHGVGYDAIITELNKGKRWQRVRHNHVVKHPFCEDCQVTVVEIVDHIIPAEIAIQQVIESRRFPLDKYAGYYLASNLQSLCRGCHAKKTAKDKLCTEWPSVLDKYEATPKKVYHFA